MSLTRLYEILDNATVAEFWGRGNKWGHPMSTFIIRDEAIRQRAIDFIAKLNLEKAWRLEIKPHKNNRSLNQNAFYWTIVGEIAKETGHTNDDVHEWLKANYLPVRIVEVNGCDRRYRPSTSKLKVDEMADYIDRCMAFATSELGIILPEREE